MEKILTILRDIYGVKINCFTELDHQILEKETADIYKLRFDTTKHIGIRNYLEKLDLFMKIFGIYYKSEKLVDLKRRIN